MHGYYKDAKMKFKRSLAATLISIASVCLTPALAFAAVAGVSVSDVVFPRWVTLVALAAAFVLLVAWFVTVLIAVHVRNQMCHNTFCPYNVRSNRSAAGLDYSALETPDELTGKTTRAAETAPSASNLIDDVIAILDTEKSEKQAPAGRLTADGTEGSVPDSSPVSEEPILIKTAEVKPTDPAPPSSGASTNELAPARSMEFTDDMIQQVLIALQQQAAHAAAEAVIAQQAAIQEQMIQRVSVLSAALPAVGTRREQYRGRHFKPYAADDLEERTARLWEVPPMRHARTSSSQKMDKVG